ncbi:MAG: ABC transporter C-terminal domain-containing protein [Thermoanaerobaculia bacterium]
MKIDKLCRIVCILLCSCPLLARAVSASEASEVRDLAARADALMRLGVAEKGASRSFEEAETLLGEAENRLAEADLPSSAEAELTLEIAAVREDLEDLVELYEERFYGVFPLARLTVPSLLADEGLVITEQVYHAPDVAAIMAATRKVADLLDEYHHPYVVFRSSPPNRHLENVASEELLRDRRSTPYTRKALVTALGSEDLAAFDRGELEPQILDRLATALDAVSLLVLTIGQSVELEDAQVRTIHGEYFQPGAVIQGSSVDSTPWVRLETFVVIGSARDRRDQHQLIIIVQLILLALALIWSAQVKWSLGRFSKVFGRLAIGAALFVFGRLFAIVLIGLLRRFIPDASALAAAAWWWPALLGIMIILGGGLIAWIGQARLTDIVPGARGARAVGTIFALVAMGAASHFVAPLLIFDPGTGLANLLPFLLATLSLALLFAFAARTGPPVPHYFTIGPLLVAPLVGMSLMVASPPLLWLTVGASVVLCAAAWIRHRIAVARGTEEPEPSPEEAAEIDKEKLMKIDNKISKKL